MDDFRADLHCHSTCSDGSDEPEELLHLAKKAYLKGLSITDHDTMAAYSPKLFALADELGIQLITGVEVSSELEGLPVHILGYGLDLNAASFLTKIQDLRIERNRAILKKLSEKKMPIDEKELNFPVVGRPHIASLMVKKGYVSSISEAFSKFLKDGASCYAKGFKYQPNEVIDFIHAAKGKAVLAHPHFYKRSFLNRLIKFSFDGIECYYGNLLKAQEAPILQVAKEKGWLATGGSDYHGKTRNISLGSSWVNFEIFTALTS